MLVPSASQIEVSLEPTLDAKSLKDLLKLLEPWLGDENKVTHDNHSPKNTNHKKGDYRATASTHGTCRTLRARKAIDHSRSKGPE